MSRQFNKIPLNKQAASAIGGLDVIHVDVKEVSKVTNVMNIHHRDDYYILILILKGSGILHLDMEQIEITKGGILLIRPYQVHAASKVTNNSEGFFISIAPFIMPDHCSNIFQALPVSKQHLKIPMEKQKTLADTAYLLGEAFTESNSHKTYIIHSLFNAMINRVAALYSDEVVRSITPANRSQLITQKFRKLISEYSFIHPPSFFSEKLNVSTSHLNDCIKSTTGLSVTNYLQEAMLLEAKRRLYYTNDDVKTIAFDLGYEDHTYFSRLFKKLTKETPLSFRNKFRE